MAEASTDKDAKERRLFSDISATQLIATALASVTSVLLASYIGIAGSLIGVAVASIVSTLAGSLYKRFISVSADKIKHLPVITEPDKTIADILPGRQREGEDVEGESADESEDSLKVKPEEPTSEEQGEGPSEESKGSLKDSSAESSRESEETALAHQKRMIRGLVIVCILSALLAAAATGAVIYFATAGEGIGTKPDPITFVSRPSSEVGTGAASQAAARESSEADESSSASSSSSSASFSASSSSSSDSVQPGDSSASASSSSSSSADSSSSSAGDSRDASEGGATSLERPADPQQTNAS